MTDRCREQKQTRVSSEREPRKPWPMNGWLFRRTADAAAARVGRKYSTPSWPTLDKHTKDEGENATGDQDGGVEVRIGSDDGFVCQRGFKDQTLDPIPLSPLISLGRRSDERAIQERGRHTYEGHQGPRFEGMRPACQRYIHPRYKFRRG